MPQQDALDSLLNTALGGSEDVAPSQWVQRHFLNPDVPYAIQDDPDGTYHAKKHQIRQPDGTPLRGLKEEEKIHLMLRPYQRRAMDVDRSWRALRWARRCMVGDTPVLMSDGSWKRIDAIEEGERVACRDDRGRILSKPVTEFWENGVKDVYEITLNNGRSITCTSNHPILTTVSRGFQNGSRERVWKSLDDGLDVGDPVVAMQQVDRWGDGHDPEFGAILGYLLTDGYMAGDDQTPKLVNTNREIIEDAQALARSRFGLECSIREKDNDYEKTCWELHFTDGHKGVTNPLTEKLKEIDAWGKKALRKTLPDIVWGWDKETVLAMVNRMIAGDGSVYTSGEKSGDRAPSTQLTIVSTSEELLRGLRLLLMKAGVNSCLGLNKKYPEEDYKTLYEIEIAALGSLEALLNQMGPVVGKEEACQRMRAALDQKNNGRYRRGQNRWMYPRIASIEHKGREPTYDITVRDHHNFIADGIVVHNTGKSFQIGFEIFYEALNNDNAQILVLAPSQNQVKVIFDDYLRPLLRTYDHRISGKVGIEDEPAEVGSTADFAVTKNTQKPQELVIVGENDHRATIRGMVISDSARGQSADFLVVDEADYADSEDMEQIVGPIMMTDPSTRMLMVSTPSGKGDTFFRDACNSTRWWSDHQDFTQLPHYDEDLWDQMAELAGGEDTNTFKREYLAQWGSKTEGVFDQEALEKSYIISPYPLVMEEIDRRKGTREPMLAADQTQHAKSELAAYNGVRPLDYDVSGSSAGARSVYRSKHRGHGVITAGTDWNDLAGMQTVLIWWPPQEMLNNGEIEVSRFPYENGAPLTTRRAKNEDGTPRRFQVGRENGSDYHDLSATEGIVIWHGRLESGRFTWASAANRVCSIMGIDDFVNAWYVDRGYGVQVNQMIKQIMESGEYIPDQRLLTKSRSVDESVLRNMNRFHPDRDPEVTGRIYRTIRFGENYDHREIDHAKGQGNYKNVMINLLQRMVEQHRLLFPYGAMTGKLSRDEMGQHTETEYNLEAREEQTVRTPVTEDDRIDENGAAPSRGDDAFGGLLTQMQTTKVDGYTPQGKPRYKGDWHAVDAVMLATLAYWENYSDQFGGNMFNPEVNAEGRTEEDIFAAANEATESAERNNERFGRDSTKREGPFRMPSYNDAREPLEALADGRRTSEEVGTSMDDMIESAQQWWDARD